MPSNSQDSDRTLKADLESLSQEDLEYWSFRGKAARQHAHAYFQYPAMMVPRMQGELISSVLRAAPETKNLFDPFVGSGTVMTEAMTQGLNFNGQDINPLAILISRSKVGPF
jgi:adenine-specific DNA methylase